MRPRTVLDIQEKEYQPNGEAMGMKVSRMSRPYARARLPVLEKKLGGGLGSSERAGRAFL